MTNLEHPWIQQTGTSRARYYGLCPECTNPMLLVNLLETDSRRTPYGRHCLRPVDGFVHAIDDIIDCPLFTATGSSGDISDQHAVLTAQGAELREFVVANADLAVGILAEDTGISPSWGLTAKLIATFLDNLLYLWPTTTQDNVPWLLARTIRSYNLYKQIIRPESDAGKAIVRSVPGYRLGPYNRLEARPGVYTPVEFSLRHHRIDSRGKGLPRETVDYVITVRDDARTRTILEKTILLRTAEFRQRVVERNPPTQRGQRIIDVARTELDRHIRERPELSGAEDTDDAMD